MPIKPYFTYGVSASDRDLITSTTTYSGVHKRYSQERSGDWWQQTLDYVSEAIWGIKKCWLQPLLRHSRKIQFEG